MGRTVAWTSVVFAVLAGPLWADDKAVLARQARSVLIAHCHRCHGEKGTVEGGLNYLLDPERLVARKKVVPGDPAASRLLQRVQAGEMPPPDAKNRPSKEELATLSEWIKVGAPLLQPAEKRLPLSYAAVLDLIDKDLAALPQEDRAFTRYLTLTHFYNAGASADELDTYRQALAKLVNSLSWASRIVVPTAVDPARTVYRIDLRKYQLTPRSWTLLTVRYRYHHNTNSAVETRIKEAIGQSPPFVRADWAAVHATEPRLYPRLLELPESFEQFEKRLRVSVDDNLRTGEVIRAGFRHSAVVDTPRLVERHETPFGALWLTTDGSRLRNLFTASATPPLRAVKGDDHLAHFHLPNGLLAYAIYRSGLNRVETSANGVHDRRSPERRVTLGMSCLSCHSPGVRAGEDQVRGHFEKMAARLTAQQLEQVRTLFPPHATFQKAATDDSRRYREAVEKTGGRPGGTDPILVLALRHEEEVDLKRAALELEQSPEELTRTLERVRDDTPRLEPLRKGGSVRRLDFVHDYRRLLPGQPAEGFVVNVGPRLRQEWLLPLTHLAAPKAELVPLLTELRQLRAPAPPAVRPFKHQGDAICLSLSSDGKTLLTGGADNAVRVWDVATGKELQQLLGHVKPVLEVALAADGLTAWSCSNDGELRRWDLRKGAAAGKVNLEGRLMSVAFAPSGQRLALGLLDGSIQLIDVATGKVERSLDRLGRVVDRFAFSSDGKRLAAMDQAGQLRVWDTATGVGRDLVAVVGHTASCRQLAFSPDGKTLASGSLDQTVCVWDVEAGKELRRIGTFPTFVNGVWFAPNGRSLYVATGARATRPKPKETFLAACAVIQVEVSTGNILAYWNDFPGIPRASVWGGADLLTLVGDHVRTWRPEQGKTPTNP